MILDEITVLYEDDDVLAVNKPAGLIVHGDGRTTEPTLADWIIEHHPEVNGVGEPLVLKDGTEIPRPGIVHRIDRETSGVLIIAKIKESFDFLKQKFKDREMTKVYVAYIYGKPRESRGIIERAIRRSRTDFRKWTSYTGRGISRPATTNFRVLRNGVGVSYVELRPKTGRTHQLRVHMASIGHPIVGDGLYGQGREEMLGFHRVALHAQSIEYINMEGKKIAVSAPLSADFIEAEKQFEDIAK